MKTREVEIFAGGEPESPEHILDVIESDVLSSFHFNAYGFSVDYPDDEPTKYKIKITIEECTTQKKD